LAAGCSQISRWYSRTKATRHATRSGRPRGTTRPAIWEEYRAIIQQHGKFSDFEYVERFRFYGHARQAYAIVAIRETAPYGNIILTKGLVKE
jgi:L-fucose mutarotase